MLQKYIGFLLKEARKKANMSQLGLALEIGKSRASLANYESGKQAIPLSTVYKLADFFGIKITDIVPDIKPSQDAMRLAMIPKTKTCPKCGGCGVVKI